jgi:general secretion pathway protein G
MELLVVLAILVLLMAMVAPRFLGVQKKADINAAKSQIGMFKAALERYALDMKGFPVTEQGLEALCEEPAEVDTMGTSGDTGSEPPSNEPVESGSGEKSTNWDGPYLNATTVPKDPWGRAYHYEYPATHGKGDFPDIWSLGPDGQEETEDDIVSWTDSQEGGESGETDLGSSRESAPPPPPRENRS